MLSNTECAGSIGGIGAGSGRSFDYSSARYGKVIIMSERVRTALTSARCCSRFLQVHAGHDQRRQGVRRGATAAPGDRADAATEPNDVMYGHVLEAELEGSAWLA